MPDILTGRGGYSPRVVALARGLVEVVVFAALVAAGEFLRQAAEVELSPEAKTVALAILAGLIRQLEGVFDNIDPTKHRANELA